MIAVDMDGTLLHSQGHVSARNLAALRMAEVAGVEVVVATGRRHSYAMRVLGKLNLPHASALISSNGTVIRTIDSRLMHRSLMPLETARWLCEHVAGFRNTMVITFDTVGANGEDVRGALVCEHMDDLQASIGKWMDSNEPYIAHVARLEDALNGEAPIQMMLCGSVERMEAAEALLTAHPKVTGTGATVMPGAEITLHRTTYPDRDLSIVDILPAGCSKASALQHLAELRGISLSDVLAIGDNWNDVPMLEAAGRAVLMSNAPDDLLAMAADRGWILAPGNDADGVAWAIEEALQPVAGAVETGV